MKFQSIAHLKTYWVRPSVVQYGFHPLVDLWIYSRGQQSPWELYESQVHFSTVHDRLFGLIAKNYDSNRCDITFSNAAGYENHLYQGDFCVIMKLLIFKESYGNN